MIRLFTPEDFALWKAMRLEAVKEHPHAYGSSYEEESQVPDEQWKERLRKNYIFAFMDGENAVGMAGYYLQAGEKRRHRGMVYTVYVMPEYRGRGAMDWLLSAIEYHARDQGAEQLHLEVGTYNDAALRCYERNGYVVYATEPRAIKVNGEYVDEHLMVKYL
jgi:ribosomal protein S18 acetylase RimI-like enzyme